VLQTPKVYFYDTGRVVGDDGLRYENLVATALHKHVQWQHDVQGQESGLHYIRTKDGAEVDFALSHQGQLTQLVECKLSDPKPHRALLRFAREQKYKVVPACSYAEAFLQRHEEYHDLLVG
jgi:predicted AAA+ superfamily ATPase